MGRGLSPLQQTIIGLALEGTQRPPKIEETSFGPVDTNKRRPHVFPADVLATCYKIGKVQKRPGYRLESYPDTAEYRRAIAAVSRAFKRLIARGLLVARHRYENSRFRRKYPSGYDLTESGQAIATDLTVKKSSTVRKS